MRTYDRVMTVDELRSYRYAQPFHPFTLTLHDGRALRVEQPLRIAFAPDGRRLAVFEGNRLSVLKIDEVRLASIGEHPRSEEHTSELQSQ